METNNTFSFRRFWLLCQQSLIINKKMIGLSIVGYAGILFIMLMLFQAGTHFRQWEFKNYFLTFFITFIILGIGFSSLAFSAFRSKEKCMFYLMLPSSTSEKYLLEFLVYIIGYIIVMPLLFLLVAYLESHMVHMFNPDFNQFSFSIPEFGNNLRLSSNTLHRGSLFIGEVEILFLIFAVFFTGASHFPKSPLSKTILTVIIIYIGFSFYASFLKYIVNMGGPNRTSGLNQLIQNDHTYSLIITGIIDIALFAIAWFKLKEKEV